MSSIPSIVLASWPFQTRNPLPPFLSLKSHWLVSFRHIRSKWVTIRSGTISRYPGHLQTWQLATATCER